MIRGTAAHHGKDTGMTPVQNIVRHIPHIAANPSVF